MDEAEWLTRDTPAAMLREARRAYGKEKERKPRLFACAVARGECVAKPHTQRPRQLLPPRVVASDHFPGGPLSSNGGSSCAFGSIVTWNAGFFRSP